MAKQRSKKKKAPKPRKSKARRAAAARAPRVGGKFASKAHRVAHPPGSRGGAVKTSAASRYLKTPQDRREYNLAVRKYEAQGYVTSDAKHMALLPYVSAADQERAILEDQAYENKMKTMASRMKRWFK